MDNITFEHHGGHTLDKSSACFLSYQCCAGLTLSQELSVNSRTAPEVQHRDSSGLAMLRRHQLLLRLQLGVLRAGDQCAAAASAARAPVHAPPSAPRAAWPHQPSSPSAFSPHLLPAASPPVRHQWLARKRLNWWGPPAIVAPPWSQTPRGPSDLTACAW